MTNDNRTLADSINHICEIYKQDPNCLTKHDLNDLETLRRNANWLLSESCRGRVNSERHHQVFDRVRSLLGKLEKRCTDYRYQKKWRQEYLRQQDEKFNPYHKPAGSPEGGQFDNAPGGGGGGGSGTGSPRAPSDSEGYGLYRTPKPKPPHDPQMHPASYDATSKVPRPPKQIRTSPDGLQKIVQNEGFEPHVYPDTAGNPTIGYGHLLKPGESFPNGVSEAHAQELLQQDLHEAENTVRNNVRVDLTQPQFDALTSFAYNVKPKEFRNSTLLRRLNQGDYSGAADEFHRWNKITDPKTGAKVPDRGLTNRRKRESDLFRSGII